MQRWTGGVVCCLAVATLACGATGPGEGPGEVSFIALPIPQSRIACIHSIGEMRAPGELLGANMSRWDVRERGACGAPAPFVGEPVSVFAAAAGEIVQVGGDGSITIAVSNDVEYTYRGVALDGFIAEGLDVTAGQRLGVVANPDSGLMFGVIEYFRVNEWVAPARYPDAFRHARHLPLVYGEPAATTIVLRTSPTSPAVGRIVWDVAGTLIGNWFHESVPQTAQAVSPTAWPGHLTFHGTGSSARVGIGSTLAPPGGCVCAVASSDAFQSITTVDGVVHLTLLRVGENGVPTTEVAGTLLVEMTAADRLRAEFFPGASEAAGFTPAALRYNR